MTHYNLSPQVAPRHRVQLQNVVLNQHPDDMSQCLYYPTSKHSLYIYIHTGLADLNQCDLTH